MAEQPALRLVDADGVIVGDQKPRDDSDIVKGLNATIADLQDQLDGSERDVRSWRARYADLARDKDKAARKDKLWPQGEALFNEWQTLTGHTRSKWTYDRFDCARPFLKNDGYDLCLLAVQGAAFDPYTKARENGTVKRFDDWELIFKSRGKFEEFCNRAPAEALKAYKAKLELAAATADEQEGAGE